MCFQNISGENNRWHGRAVIPVEYFPPNVDRFNLYSIHGTEKDGNQRIYKSFVAVPGPYPDFHRLECFADFLTVIEEQLPSLKSNTTLSNLWKDALDS